MTPRGRAEPFDLQASVAGVRCADRAALGRAITLMESEASRKAQDAQQLLGQLLPHTGHAIRLGITGVPGVGKSMLIDALGTWLTARDHRVAVLAVDPSSAVSGGSILGDKTRMSRLANDARAFVRPSPSGGSLGGVARKTRESMLVCEAAGFDVAIVETVGVGQSETTVAEMVDFFLVLMLAGAGDELQGIKRGVLELADMLAITKADGDNLQPAQRARREYEGALRLMRSRNASWIPPVIICSAQTELGLEALWTRVTEHRDLMQRSGELQRRRKEQQVRWMWSLIRDGLMAGFRSDPRVRHQLPVVEDRVAAGQVTAANAAHQLLSFLGKTDES